MYVARTAKARREFPHCSGFPGEVGARAADIFMTKNVFAFYDHKGCNISLV